jgi:hypothetical protein
VEPRQVEIFQFSTDPELVAMVTDVVEFYLHSPGERHRAQRG